MFQQQTFSLTTRSYWGTQMQWTREGFVLTDQPPPTAIDETYALLQTTYWSHKRPRDVVERIVGESLCFYLSKDQRQVGFGRVISDYVTTSWIADVVLAKEYQGDGLGSWMMRCVLDHPKLRSTQFALQTGTAHSFYERLGFAKNDALMSTPVDYL